MGIPFAAPPVGALRWRPPQPPAPWTGLRDASNFGHDCAQPENPIFASMFRATLSEDCLYVNVWRPAHAKPDAKLPVVVWIYGGGFVAGGASMRLYDGTHFAAKGVVFVAANYRLGRFGFFAFPALTAENPGEAKGNYAFMDQIATLKWVKANIASFGGDPSNVFLFGESAGGASVLTMLTSPAATGLFARAGIESGGGRTSFSPLRHLSENLPNLPSAESIGVNFAKENGINGTDAAALATLRALPVETITAGTEVTSVQKGSTWTGPIQDGTIVQGEFEDMFKAGRMAHVPILVGANSADIGIPSAKTLDEAFTPFGADAAAARAAYGVTANSTPYPVIMAIASDVLMVEPARFVASTYANQGLPVYTYRFSFVSPTMAGSPMMAGRSGAPHGTELRYVFDTLLDILEDKATSGDKAMTAAMNTYWVNFAKQGNPNGAGLPEWPSYAVASDEIMDFTQQGPVSEQDPWAPRLDLLEQHIDTLTRRGKTGS